MSIPINKNYTISPVTISHTARASVDSSCKITTKDLVACPNHIGFGSMMSVHTLLLTISIELDTQTVLRPRMCSQKTLITKVSMASKGGYLLLKELPCQILTHDD